MSLKKFKPGWIPHSDAVADDNIPFEQSDVDKIKLITDPSIVRLLKPLKIAKLPTAFSLNDKITKNRYDQGDIGLCFAFAGTGISEYFLENDKKSPNGELSQLFTGYWSRYILNGDKPPVGDDGSTIVATMESLQEYGVCAAKLWPYVESNENIEPPKNAIEAGHQIEVGRYFTIAQKQNNTKINQIKQALTSGSPMMFGSTVNESIENVGSDGLEPYAPKDSKEDPVAGGHARWIIGYDDNIEIPNAPIKGAFRVMNSWGSDWGDNGESWVSYQVWLDQETDDMGITSMNIESSPSKGQGVVSLLKKAVSFLNIPVKTTIQNIK